MLKSFGKNLPFVCLLKFSFLACVRQGSILPLASFQNIERCGREGPKGIHTRIQ